MVSWDMDMSLGFVKNLYPKPLDKHNVHLLCSPVFSVPSRFLNSYRKSCGSKKLLHGAARMRTSRSDCSFLICSILLKPRPGGVVSRSEFSAKPHVAVPQKPEEIAADAGDKITVTVANIVSKAPIISKQYVWAFWFWMAARRLETSRISCLDGLGTIVTLS